MSMPSHFHEQALLAAICQDPDWTRKHANQIPPELFEEPIHRLVFEAVIECGENW